ncbi:MAG: DMT family transporter [Desulfobacterales bacterium]|nr:DMT family transporter [Desulfobacterales bacterium]
MNKMIVKASLKPLTGPALMFASALLFTGLNGLIKILGPSFSVWDIAVYRFVLGGIALIILSGPGRNPYKGSNQKLLIVRGVSGSIAFLCLVLAIRLAPVSTALALFYSFPAFTALFAVFFFRERLTAREMLCIAATFIGVATLFDIRLDGGAMGQFMALLGGAFAGITVCLIKQLREKNGPVIIYLYLCTMGAIISLPGFLADPRLPVTGREWLIVGGVVATSVSAQLLMNQGFLYCKSWEGGLYMTSELIFTAALGICFLGEPMTWRLFLGGLLILSGVITLNLLAVRKRKKA